MLVETMCLLTTVTGVMLRQANFVTQIVHGERNTMSNCIHESRVGTYHPAPGNDVAWTVNDTHGYLDAGPSCDECQACECGEEPCEDCGHRAHEPLIDDCSCCERHEPSCIGLSFAFLCLDSGEALCPECAEKEGIEIVPCDCQ